MTKELLNDPEFGMYLIAAGTLLLAAVLTGCAVLYGRGRL